MRIRADEDGCRNVLIRSSVVEDISSIKADLLVLQDYQETSGMKEGLYLLFHPSAGERHPKCCLLAESLRTGCEVYLCHLCHWMSS